MSAEPKQDLQLEIAHFLLIDVVGYSKLLVNEQIEVIQELNRIVRATSCFQAAQAENKLIRVPTGDGMALIFFRSPEEPARCAVEISERLKEHPEIAVRMGVHSGPVNQVTDVNDQVNVAGTGINVAQRVMDCGDAGHILLSKHVADDLAQYRHWKPYLHDFGEFEVKHGLRLHIVNLYKNGMGNPGRPAKVRHGGGRNKSGGLRRVGVPWPVISAVALAVIALAISFFVWRSIKTSRLTAPHIPEKSIAVLPFENLGADPDSATFADGVHDEILTDLAKIADLKVISRTSVMQYKRQRPSNLREIAKTLGVANVVEGSVQRTGDRVRVSAQLIDAKTDMHLWADRYERDIADVFAIQSEIAKAIADQLHAKISPSEEVAIASPPTGDLTAFSLYVRAKTLWPGISDPQGARQKLPEVQKLLEQAVARDPRFLRGWCLLSKVHGVYYWFGFDRSSARLAMAEAAVRRALELQPGAGEAHLALAVYYYYGFLDYSRAREELEFAANTLPNNSEVFEYTGYIQRRQGDWEASTKNLTRALELDPRNVFTLRQLANSYRSQHRYDDQQRTLDLVQSIIPDDPVIRISRAHVALDWHGDVRPFQVALAALLKQNASLASIIDDPDYALCERTTEAAARSLAHYPPAGVTANFGVNCPRAYWEGVVARWQGQLEKARDAFQIARSETEKLLATQPDYPPAISLIGMIDAGLGRNAEAIREGEQACRLLPVSKDAVTGAALQVNLAQIYAWAGEKDLAIDQIARIESLPNELSYGLLKLHPYWDSLRGDPRFESLVASLVEKTIVPR